MIPHKDVLNIFYFNANGINNKIHEIYAFMNHNAIDIACISETFLKSSMKLNRHPNFLIYRHDRDDEQLKGGVLIIVNRNIPHQQLPRMPCDLIENICVEVSTIRSKLIFSSCYLPGGTRTPQINHHLKNDIATITRRRTRFYAMGDFNAKHRYWGCNRANTAGKILYTEFCNRDFDIIFPHEHSYHPFDANRASSTLDICLTNSDLHTSDLSSHQLGSDHNGITFQIKLDEYISPNANRTYPCFRSANWKLYESVINRKLIDMDFDANRITNTDQIDNLVDKLTTTMHEAKSVAVPMVSKSNNALELTPDILQMILTRSDLQRRYQRSQVLSVKIYYKWQVNRLQKEISRAINELRNNNWSNFLQSIPTDDNYRKLWKTSKFLKNKNRIIPPLIVDSTNYVSPLEKANVLADQFAKAHDNPLANEMPQFTNEVVNETNAFCTQATEVPESDLPSLTEIQGYVKRLKNKKAPGPDAIHNTLIKHLPHHGLLLLHLIVVSCFKLCYFPVAWKHANIIPIHKPGKKTNDPSSYRPISLLSAISKILERAILTRLNFHLYDNNIIPEDQCGFVHGKSTSHQLVRIRNHIHDHLRLKSSTGMLLIDVEKAFDRVWFAGLIKKMILFDFPTYLIKIVNSFLRNRSFVVKVDGRTSQSHPIPFGTPQGAVCSPTLYNIYTSDSPNPAPCERGLFADDTCFFISSPTRATITTGLRQTMLNYLDYFKTWKINLNLSKSQAMFFTRRRKLEIPKRPLRIAGNSTLWASEPVKYLGVLLDKTVTLRQHINYVINKANTTIKILYPLINRRSKLSVQNKLLLYKAAIRPVMTYASPVLISCAATNINKLQICQNKILRMIYDVPYTTPTTTLHEMADIETIKEHINKLNENFLLRLSSPS